MANNTTIEANVACGTCGAGFGVPCRTPRGLTTEPHAIRVRWFSEALGRGSVLPAFDRGRFSVGANADDWYITEASDLGLKPGSFPRAFLMGGQRFTIKRVQRSAGDVGEIVSVHYSTTGRTAHATILND